MERHTRQRQAVLDALAGTGRTLTPPEILALAQRQAPSLNLSTVYRQVKALEEAGEVLKVQLPGQPARFEAACGQATGAVCLGADRAAADAGHAHTHSHAPASVHADEGEGAADTGHHHHHHHFHCLACDQVVPIHGCPGPMQELAPAGFVVERHDLVLHGRCADCALTAAA